LKANLNIILNRKFIRGIFFVFTILFIVSCGSNPLDIDVSKVNLNLKIKRFDKDLFAYKKGITDKDIALLHQEYGQFFDDFTSRIINIGKYDDPSVAYQINSFTNDSYISKVYQDVENQYNDFSSLQSDLLNAFKHYKYYFPQKKIPEIITYLSGFNYSVATDSNYLAIGLDMFLGDNYKAYDNLGIPKYKSKMMDKSHLVSGAVLSWIATEFLLNKKDANLLEEIIHHGKLLYLMDALMPKTDEENKIGYTPEQIKWCYDNEKEIWFFLVDNNLLYTKNATEITKFMGEAPFTDGFSRDSPGKIGQWLGYQIVKKYMTKHPEISIPQLLKDNDAQKILNQSKYKPS